MINFYINSDLLQFLCRIWIGTREYLPYICRIYILSTVNIGNYRRSISTATGRMTLDRWVNGVWAIGGVTKIKQMGTILYKITKGNIMKVDMGGILMGCFIITQNGGLV